MRRVFLFLGLTLAAAGAAQAQAQDDHWQKLFEVNQRFAQAGSKEGQFKLGEMYEQGVGTARDAEQARLWYGKAAQQGHPEAQRRLDGWDTRQAERARNAEMERLRAVEEQARQAAQRRVEEEKRARETQARAQQAAQKRLEEEKALAARRRAEQEKARLAALRKADQEKARQEALQKRSRDAEDVAPAPTPVAAAEPPASDSIAGEKTSENFETDPCKTPAAKFMSTCRNR